MRLLIVSDAWAPQVNGVVTSLTALVSELRGMGHCVEVLSPGAFRCVPCPGYPEIPLAWNLWRVAAAIEAFAPDGLHLATEGPLGWAARRWLLRRGLAFSSAIHTRFPEYLKARCRWFPLALGYAYLRLFHRHSQAVLVSTERLREDLGSRGLRRLALWRKGVNSQLFAPRAGAPAPLTAVFLYVGRIAAEKNLQAFLELDLPGEKWVVGDGPQREALQQVYDQVKFFGYRHGEALAECYRRASVLVFPSRTDTYGLVMLEAQACGTPVAAFAVPGPLDVVVCGVTGVLADDLREACLAAVELDRARCAQEAGRQSWRASAVEFLARQPLLNGEQVCVAMSGESWAVVEVAQRAQRAEVT
ncbi:Glycosyltransferase involved in cell wall bisynthesis [Pseudomonas flavescens]|uniref:Glycosyltransferase involved in cell wall bisynthesis n=1 Tax=Phytopseudomonas flavescens TaxID=29435 RepID=A0A1G8L4W8_9GAMM|nr:glycosyltransferase family 1 protein [Pseudomonas flavescens]SDI50631.1 Glycosyltransferase involved in cell wall bisynthesis [Pseudomonas flavescens]